MDTFSTIPRSPLLITSLIISPALDEAATEDAKRRKISGVAGDMVEKFLAKQLTRLIMNHTKKFSHVNSGIK